jgi:hypothetical protein
MPDHKRVRGYSLRAIGRERVCLPDGRWAPVVEVYDDEAGQVGDVRATLVVDPS